MKKTFTIFTILFALNSFPQIISEPRLDREDLPPVRVDDVSEIRVGEIEEDLVFPYAILEKTPCFPDCKFTNETENKACFNEEFQKHIKKHLKYPKEAKKNKITARAIVLFEITKEGNISNIKTKITATNKEYSADFEEEALRIINKLPQFIPGEHRGKTVVVSYAIPIVFSLTDQ